MFGRYQEILLLLLLALIIFGSKRLPDIAKSLGKSVKEFKKGMDPNSDDEDDGDKHDQSGEKNDKPAKEILKTDTDKVQK